MWFSSRYVNGGGLTNLVAPLQRVRQKALAVRTWEDFLALGAIGEWKFKYVYKHPWTFRPPIYKLTNSNFMSNN